MNTQKKLGSLVRSVVYLLTVRLTAACKTRHGVSFIELPYGYFLVASVNPSFFKIKIQSWGEKNLLRKETEIYHI